MTQKASYFDELEYFMTNTAFKKSNRIKGKVLVAHRVDRRVVQADVSLKKDGNDTQERIDRRDNDGITCLPRPRSVTLESIII